MLKKTKEKHSVVVESIRAQLKQMREQRDAPLCLQNHNHSSNVTRSPTYKKAGRQLDINKLNRVLSLDVERGVVVVEPRVTMVQLARATLKQGVMVPVMPEFKGITVGGAIMGAGIESASHRYGIFSDCCLSYEILLGDGSIVRASREEHSDLFYAVVGSYGAFGILLSAEIKLIPVKPWVKLTYRTFRTLDATVAHLKSISHRDNSPEFIEGLAFSKEHQVVIEGSFLSDEEAKNFPSTLSLKRWWSQWFFCHANAVSKEGGVKEEKISLFDYLFRHDRGAFWIGGYGTYLPLLTRYFVENRLKLPALARLLPKFSRKDLKGPKDPSFLFRLSLGWTMSSQRLYSWLHSRAEEWVATRSVIQDFCLPSGEVAPFTAKVFNEVNIFPLWLCPTPITKTPQIFSPHYLLTCSEDLVINVGVYGLSPSPLSGPELTVKLEEWTRAAGGRKALYSHSYYSKKTFWTIYPKKVYEDLRRSYHAETWTPIEKKALKN